VRLGLSNEVFRNKKWRRIGARQTPVSEIPLEEAQASIRAARFAPSLSSTERYTLLRDGITRLYKANIKKGESIHG